MAESFVPFCAVKQDFAARQTGIMVYTEVLDTEPNWNALDETTLWLRGAGGGASLLFNGHIDTNPVSEGWTVDPWGGKVEA